MSADPGDGTFHYYTGEHMLLRGEPAVVKNALRKIGVELDTFIAKVTGVYARPRPVGFDFVCGDPKALLAVLRKTDALREDDRSTRSGKFVAAMSDGASFRQVGAGRALHLTASSITLCFKGSKG